MGLFDWLPGVVTTVGGVVNYFDSKKRRKEMRGKIERSEQELNQQKEAFASLDTSNPYLNLENMFEDATVDQKAAEFTKQQQFQNQANILQQMRGAAGSSGIAALAQTLANQGALDAQTAAVSIGEQERSNQEKKLTESARIQGLEREGDLISRQAKADKVGTLMGMAADKLASENLALSEINEQMAGSFGTMSEGVSDLVGGI